jgi:hypothetical protein
MVDSNNELNTPWGQSTPGIKTWTDPRTGELYPYDYAVRNGLITRSQQPQQYTPSSILPQSSTHLDNRSYEIYVANAQANNTAQEPVVRVGAFSNRGFRQYTQAEQQQIADQNMKDQRRIQAERDRISSENELPKYEDYRYLFTPEQQKAIDWGLQTSRADAEQRFAEMDRQKIQAIIPKVEQETPLVVREQTQKPEYTNNDKILGVIDKGWWGGNARSVFGITEPLGFNLGDIKYPGTNQTIAPWAEEAGAQATEQNKYGEYTQWGREQGKNIQKTTKLSPEDAQRIIDNPKSDFLDVMSASAVKTVLTNPEEVLTAAEQGALTAPYFGYGANLFEKGIVSVGTKIGAPTISKAAAPKILPAAITLLYGASVTDNYTNFDKKNVASNVGSGFFPNLGFIGASVGVSKLPEAYDFTKTVKENTAKSSKMRMMEEIVAKQQTPRFQSISEERAFGKEFKPTNTDLYSSTKNRFNSGEYDFTKPVQQSPDYNSKIKFTDEYLTQKATRLQSVADERGFGTNFKPTNTDLYSSTKNRFNSGEYDFTKPVQQSPDASQIPKAQIIRKINIDDLTSTTQIKETPIKINRFNEINAGVPTKGVRGVAQDVLSGVRETISSKVDKTNNYYGKLEFRPSDPLDKYSTQTLQVYKEGRWYDSQTGKLVGSQKQSGKLIDKLINKGAPSGSGSNYKSVTKLGSKLPKPTFKYSFIIPPNSKKPITKQPSVKINTTRSKTTPLQLFKQETDTGSDIDKSIYAGILTPNLFSLKTPSIVTTTQKQETIQKKVPTNPIPTTITSSITKLITPQISVPTKTIPVTTLDRPTKLDMPTNRITNIIPILKQPQITTTKVINPNILETPQKTKQENKQTFERLFNKNVRVSETSSFMLPVFGGWGSGAGGGRGRKPIRMKKHLEFAPGSTASNTAAFIFGTQQKPKKKQLKKGKVKKTNMDFMTSGLIKMKGGK